MVTLAEFARGCRLAELAGAAPAAIRSGGARREQRAAHQHSIVPLGGEARRMELPHSTPGDDVMLRTSYSAPAPRSILACAPACAPACIAHSTTYRTLLSE